MPHRNLATMFVVSVLSLMCYLKVETNRYGRILGHVMDQIEKRALEPVDKEQLFEAAMRGMMTELDEYSAYIPPKRLKQFNEDLDQEFGGVGIEVALDPKTKQLTVVRPLVGAPAYNAGIRTGDTILSIDGDSTHALSLTDMVNRMRGKPGDPVVLSVLHRGEEEAVEITIVRAVIKVDTVMGDTRNEDGSWNFFLEGHDKIGYVRIRSFADRTAGELKETLDGLVEHRMKGLILDLRHNPGGLLGAATEICDMFVDSGVIVTIRRRDGSISAEYAAGSNGTYPEFPMAVLVDYRSASASEIVAACLQDYSRAVIVGQRTWGKGTVQEVIPLESRHGALKLTFASYWRPSEKNIHRMRDADGKPVGEEEAWGVSPDQGYEVVVEGDDLIELMKQRQRRDADEDEPGEGGKPYLDPQLKKAMEYVRGEIE